MCMIFVLFLLLREYETSQNMKLAVGELVSACEAHSPGSILVQLGTFGKALPGPGLKLEVAFDI